jgi:class 3 adenylate cyclase/ABC-type transport system substrate-binding protein
MSAIFISYRREDSQDITDRIREHLARTYGTPDVFLDTDSIPGGVDFTQALDEALTQCDVVLVVIGPKWASTRQPTDAAPPSNDRDDPDDPDGARARDRANDFVRLEVESALRRHKVVIPLLVGGAQMPQLSDLPQSLADLVNRQALPIRSGRDFLHDIDALVDTINRLRVSGAPTGTVTFLFTDIEGSTQLQQRVGARYGEVRAEHERILRQAWVEHHGHEVDTQGDAFFVAFARATDALAAAAQAQRATLAYPWPAGAPVRVRMGLHTGAGELSHGHYVGLDVNRAARICAAGHGGQVLLSQATRDQVAQELVAGEGIRDLGKHRLKDLPQREEIYQLTLPGLPTSFPPLKTLDAWPGYRADLVAVLLISAALLGLVGLALPYAVPVFPRAIGLGAAGVALLFLVAQALGWRRWLVSEWRNARKPAAAVTSGLLTLVVVTTTLFITKPAIFPPPSNCVSLRYYCFSYTYHQPTHRGGQVTIATPYGVGFGMQLVGFGGSTAIFLWQGCIIQLPDTSLGLAGWRPNQCTQVPTIDNGDESLDLKTTTLHIDPRAVWSDGVPLTADDFRFAENVSVAERGYDPLGEQSRTLVVLDPHTLVIKWAHQFSDYLTAVEGLTPWPLHALATGKLAGVYDPKTGAVNRALADQLLAPYTAGQPPYPWNPTPKPFPVVNGPFLVQSSATDTHGNPSSVTLTRNPHYFSNFFHAPALDQVTFIADPAGGMHTGDSWSQEDESLSAGYRSGSFDIVEGLTVPDVRQLGAIPAAQVISSPLPSIGLLAFNQRGAAPNAQANGGVSIFSDRTVRQAFVEAFDRCGALRAVVGISNCADPNLVTDELTTAASADYDPSFKLPAYNPTDAAKLLTDAGYLVVDNIRRARDGKTPLQISVNLLSYTAAQYMPIAERMQQDYERNLKITVHLVVDTITFDTNPYGQPGLESGDFDIGVYGEFDSTTDPADVALDSTVIGAPDTQDIPNATKPNGSNTYGVIDPYIITKVNEGQMAPPGDQSNLVFSNLERYVAEQYYAEPFYINSDVALVKPTICNYKKNPNPGVGNEWNMADWYIAPSCPS